MIGRAGLVLATLGLLAVPGLIAPGLTAPRLADSGLAAPGAAGSVVAQPVAGPAPPQPPPVRGGPPAGRRPGPFPGLRAPARCVPPPADPAPELDVAGQAERMQLSAAHRLATGAGQLIAVIDTGVAPHERLGTRLRPGGDYLTGGDGLDDCDGHGTAVAGILSAAAPAPGPAGGPDVVGMAPGARLLAIRQSSPSFEVTGLPGERRPAGDTDTLAEAIVLAVRQGATVVNISEAVCLPAERAAAVGDPVHAALRFAAEADVVVVAAAGNTGTGSCTAPGVTPGQVSLPGWYDQELLTVAAVGPGDLPAPFTVPGPWVDVAAPGTGLRSLAVGGGTTSSGVDGTSFAAPWVAGLAALVRERFPELSARQVADRIVATARRPAGGRDDSVGHGMIDPIAALTALPAVLDPSVLLPGARPATVPAELLGPAPEPSTTPSTVPAELIAGGALLAAGAAAALRLRGRTRR